MSSKKIGFIGCGNIASAIIGGACGMGYINYDNLYLFDTDSSKTDAFVKKGANLCASAAQLVSRCDFVFLTIKPQIYDIVLPEIAEASRNACIISVAAGITVDYVKKLLGYDARVIRVMPNTPLMYGGGATALVHTAPVTDEDYSFVRQIFSLSGVCVDLDESQINTVTAISGSAPAYVLRFAKNLIGFAVSSGMNESDAKKLVLGTLAGTALMSEESEEDIDKLIRNVTSPNGTTYAGLCSMDETGFDDSLIQCLEATKNRAEELTK